MLANLKIPRSGWKCSDSYWVGAELEGHLVAEVRRVDINCELKKYNKNWFIFYDIDCELKKKKLIYIL